jgi:hypothetical protein
MSNDLMLDVGQANELKLAFRRADFSNDDIKRLCEGSVLTDVRSVLRGHAAINVVEHVIDCDAQPFVPDGWSVEEHQKGGSWKWDASKIYLYTSPEQLKGSIEGNKLREKLGKISTPVLNANTLDYLLANPHLIPEEWKGKYVFFWGTVYRYRGGDLYVRCLGWGGDGWYWRDFWLGLDFLGSHPAAVQAS